MSKCCLLPAAGNKIHLQPSNGSSNQQWVVDGKKISNKSTKECLDIYGEKKDDGAEVGSYKFKDSKNQLWRVEYV